MADNAIQDGEEVVDSENDRNEQSIRQSELTYEEPSLNEASASSKKRKRSPSDDKMLILSSMTLRKKARTNYADFFKQKKQPKPQKVEETTN